MAAIFKIAEGVPCRACGAVLAPAGGNEFGLCANCWKAVGMHCGATFDMRRGKQRLDGITEDDVTGWLAHKLITDLKRLQRDGMVGRCEAISGWAAGHPGTQCAKPATHHRDGHRVCGKHAKATSPAYVGDVPNDPYLMLRDIMSDLTATDPRFAEIVREVAGPVGLLSHLSPSQREALYAYNGPVSQGDPAMKREARNG